MFHPIPDRSRTNLVVVPLALPEEMENAEPGLKPAGDPTLEDIEGPAIPEPVTSCLVEALQVLEDLEKSVSLTRVAAKPFGDTAFGIGHMLHHARKRGMVCPDILAAELTERLRERMTESCEDGFASRMQAVAALRELHLVSGEIPDRNLKPSGTTPCIRSIAALMEEIRNISFETIISASRGKPVVQARFETIWIMRQVCGHSLTVIGRNVGGRDHTTVLNSLNKMTLEKTRDGGKKKNLQRLCERADLIGIQKNRRILAMQAAFSD